MGLKYSVNQVVSRCAAVQALLSGATQRQGYVLRNVLLGICFAVHMCVCKLVHAQNDKESLYNQNPFMYLGENQ